MADGSDSIVADCEACTKPLASGKISTEIAEELHNGRDKVIKLNIPWSQNSGHKILVTKTRSLVITFRMKSHVFNYPSSQANIYGWDLEWELDFVRDIPNMTTEKAAQVNCSLGSEFLMPDILLFLFQLSQKRSS